MTDWRTLSRVSRCVVERAGLQRADAEDVSQNACVRVLELQARGRSMRNWVGFAAHAAKAKAFNHIRDTENRHRLLQRIRPDETYTMPLPADPRNLSDMPEEVRLFAAGMSYIDISRVVGCTDTTVCNRIRRWAIKHREELEVA